MVIYAEPKAADWLRLPSEVWYKIVHLLSDYDTRECLQACRYLHDIAVRRVFRNITLEFGAWENLKPAYNPTNELAQTLEQRSLARSTAIAQHIQRSPLFASIIRKIEVRSFESPGGMDGERE